MKVKQTDDVSIGPKLQKIREARGYSQASLATKLQNEGYFISRDTITKIETGRSNIRISFLNHLVELYEVDYEDFFLADKPVPPRKSEIRKSEEKKET